MIDMRCGWELSVKRLLCLIWGVLAGVTASAQTSSQQQSYQQTVVVLGSAEPCRWAESPRSSWYCAGGEWADSGDSAGPSAERCLDFFWNSAGRAGRRRCDAAWGRLCADAGAVEWLSHQRRAGGASQSGSAGALEAMDSIQVLHGAGSTLHGVDALSGVVDFLTVAPRHGLIQMNAGRGALGRMSSRLWPSGCARDGADGRQGATIFDRLHGRPGLSQSDGFARGWVSSRLGLTNVLLAGSDRAFGADQFYGPYPSWERTKGGLPG